MFTLYKPENPLPHVLYLKNDQDVDWYEYSKELSDKTMKILVDSGGFISQVGKDATQWFPIGMSVFEVKSLPKDFSIGKYNYDNGKFVAIETTSAYQRSRSRNLLTSRIKTLKDKIDLLRLEREYADLSPEKDADLKESAKEYIALRAELQETTDKEIGA